MGVILVLLLFLVLGTLEASICPPKEDMFPCECYFMFGYNQILCRNILRPEDLHSPMRSIARAGTKVLSLTIEDSSLSYLPDDLFKNTHIEKVRFINTEIMSLTESDTAFNGLEEILEEIRATDAKFVSQWDFDTLRNLHKLSLIDVNKMILGSVDHPLPNLPELTALGIIGAEISYIAKSAFSDLPKLKIFNMKNNEIAEMSRNMFPDPAEELYIIDLSNNKLTNLPEDFFNNMPIITDVMLDKNKFLTIAEKPFSKAMDTLKELTLSENPLRCDCRMRWLVHHRLPISFKGQCSSPEVLLGREIKYLDLKSLRC